MLSIKYARDNTKAMKKTLILAVDRDDDFGAKGGVASPAIGMDACYKAAAALGTADPEDSDTNALYAAMNIYRQMEADGDNPAGSFEVALICGNRKVGYKSDEALVEQLDKVIADVRPDRAILVSDGAEDEYIYPIISSRVPIISVRKVYVKQAPGVEGTFYIIQKTLEDPQKKERFLAPIAWIVLIISAVYLVVNMYDCDSAEEYVLKSTTPLIFFIVGVLLIIYSYSLDDRIHNLIKRSDRDALDLIFLLAGMAFIVVGVVFGYFSLSEYYTPRITQKAYIFLSNALWPAIFGLMTFTFGSLLDEYFSKGKVKIVYVVRFLDLVAIGLILCGVFDLIGESVDIVDLSTTVVGLELIGGFLMAIFATVMQIAVHRGQAKKEEEDELPRMGA